MSDDDCAAPLTNRPSEHLARVNKTGINGSQTYQLHTIDDIASVEVKRSKMLFITGNPVLRLQHLTQYCVGDGRGFGAQFFL